MHAKPYITDVGVCQYVLHIWIAIDIWRGLTILHLPGVGMSEGIWGEAGTVLLSRPAVLLSCPAVLLSCPAVPLSGAARTGLAVGLGVAGGGPLLAGGRPPPLSGHRA